MTLNPPAAGTDPTSKTFLARLCEQAERYDGKPLRNGMW